MKVQEQLKKRIEKYIEKLKKEKSIEDIYFKVTQAKTTCSIYITVGTMANETPIKLRFRISDHYSKKTKTKIVTKSTSFLQIQNKINEMIVDVRKLRVKLLLNEIKK